ncbi:SRPBCC family protein [Salinibacterium soli]|uniref:SRPBCC domain-containing protein n=1 Tax=Antiquaquibacter soli TaxID=3064523 RepID=A0ABT9BKE1_9MICO|nr:SRPBCC domain-containing protein [Protaetiibacter sp. WY-16]MDO7880898.1 SRPBCC domain-containing protein [Protaetiibacter sp. WY-16]
MTTEIGAPAELVWRYLTADRDEWWPEMQFDPVVGSPLLETWTDDGQRYSATGTVTGCVESRLLAFHWIEASWAQPLDVEIRLTARGKSTAVTLTETGFALAQTSPLLPDEHEEGWRHHLSRLARMSETGSI